MTTPLPLDNPPGQDTISYRVGRYGDFRQSMLARLSDATAPFTPLLALRTRAPDDPTIALIDAFAAIGEVLTFYQERLANEGYLRTATEPRSVAELARLTGYRPKAGLASSVFLSFTADPTTSLTLSAGARAQSVPPAGQTAQSFETSDNLVIQGAWNALSPRLSQPTQASADLSQVFVDGVTTGLKPNDPLLLVVDDEPTLRRVNAVTAQPDRKRTVVVLQPMAAPPTTSAQAAAPTGSLPTSTTVASPPPTPTSGGDAQTEPSIINVVHGLANLAAAPPAAHPSDPSELQRTSSSLLSATSDAAVALAAGSSSADRSRVYKALALTPLAPAAKLEVHAFRSITAPSGARAPPRTVDANGRVLTPPQEWDLTIYTLGPSTKFSITIEMTRGGDRSSSIALMRATGGDPAESGGAQISSKIDYGGATLSLALAASAGAAASGTLQPVGEISSTLRQLDTTGLVIAYDFTDQPVSLLVSVSASGQATVVNEIASNAATSLAVTDNLRESRIEVNGLLAPQTGSQSTEQPQVLYLDGAFDTVTPGSWVAFDAPLEDGQPAPPAPIKVAAQGVSTVTRVAYGQTAKVTRLNLESAWIDPKATTFARAIRETAVFANSTSLTLVDEDIVDPVSQTASSPTLELDGFVPGLASGRWLIVTGERTDLPGSVSAEVAMLAGADHEGSTLASSPSPTSGGPSYAAGETVHTTLTFADPLAYTYKRETMSILGNVARASQGESVDEILGSGSGAIANQAFALKKPPLTYVSAVTPSGSASTLRIYVNGLQWKEVASFGAQGATDRVFVTHPSSGGGVTVRFGDGVHGARLPTGSDNVRARYRSGLGVSGNAGPGTISTLLSRPLGLKAVTNPIGATGGADAETPDEIRRTAPLGLVSLSRLVAVRDYEDFAQSFAGIGKASAKRFAGPDGPLVHVTIAGAADDALDPTSDLWSALEAALNDFGDAEHEVELAARTAKLALISANIAIDSDRLWSDVEPDVRARLLDVFSFGRRRLGEDLHSSDVITAIQGIAGVSYVDLRLLSAVAAPANTPELTTAVKRGGVETITAHLARVAGDMGARQLLPAELVYLSGSLPDMLVLNEVTT